jgi:hypothetical protein
VRAERLKRVSAGGRPIRGGAKDVRRAEGERRPRRQSSGTTRSTDLAIGLNVHLKPLLAGEDDAEDRRAKPERRPVRAIRNQGRDAVGRAARVPTRESRGKSYNRISQNADAAVDLDLYNIARPHPQRRLAREADPFRRAGCYNIASDVLAGASPGSGLLARNRKMQPEGCARLQQRGRRHNAIDRA